MKCKSFGASRAGDDWFANNVIVNLPGLKIFNTLEMISRYDAADALVSNDT